MIRNVRDDGTEAYVSPPPSVLDAGGATDDQLSGLLDSLRRYIRDAPSGTWPPEIVVAARTVTTAVSARLAEGNDD